jgi:integrase
MNTSIERHTNDGLRKVCRCPRRVWAKCDHSWYFNFKWAGVPHRYGLDKLLQRKIRSRTEAVAIAEDLRTAIRNGTLAAYVAANLPTPMPSAGAVDPEEMTFATYGAIFLKHCPKKKGKHAGQPRGVDDASKLARLATLPGTQGPLGAMPISGIVEADLEAALGALRAEGRANSTYNNYLQLCQSLSKWGKKKGYLTRSWFAEDSDIKRENLRGDQRHRRLLPDVVLPDGSTQAGEERRLLAVATTRLQALIIAALETGCRAGELLDLQWQHVADNLLRIPAALTKAGRFREIPSSTRLRALLEMRRTDPAGRPFPAHAYVFGNEVGERESFPKRAWETTVLKAHGHTPEWEPGKGKLTVASRAVLQACDLHFHDLRHEAGSRFLEQGWDLHEVRDMLGQADISTTSRYLNVQRLGLQAAMKRSEEGASVAKTLQKLAADGVSTMQKARKRTASKLLIH